MSKAIEERDIFKALVIPPDASSEEYREVLTNIQLFQHRVPVNIFTNEYYALYESILTAKKYGGLLNYRQYNQIIINNIEKLIKSPNVNVMDFASDPSDEDLTKREFLHLCMTVFEELSEETCTKEEFLLNTDLYVQSWADEEIKKLLAESYTIASEGMKIKGKFTQGFVEADSYYKEGSNKINAILNSSNRKLPPVIIGPKGYSDFKERESTTSAIKEVSVTNIEYVDRILGTLNKGDMVTILGASGGGKTRQAVNIGYNAKIRGKNGAHLALEGKPEEVFYMYLAKHLAEKYNMTKVDATMLKDKTYPENLASLIEEAENDFFYNPAYGVVSIIPPPVYDTEIISLLENWWDSEHPFDFVTLDYASLVLSRNYDNRTRMLENLIPELKSAATSFRGEGFLLIMPHQLKQETVEAIIRGNTDITITGGADSSEINKSADIVITVFIDDDMKLKNKALMINTKARDSIGFGKIEVMALLGNCFYREIKEA